MDAKQIMDYREAFYKELSLQAKNGTFNMPEKDVDAYLRHVAFEWPDKDIIELAESGISPAQAAADELM